MADGIPCKNCGHYEAAHFDNGFVNPDNLRDGYKKTLNNCPGYTPENPKLAKELKEEAKKEAEIQNKIKSKRKIW